MIDGATPGSIAVGELIKIIQPKHYVLGIQTPARKPKNGK